MSIILSIFVKGKGGEGLTTRAKERMSRGSRICLDYEVGTKKLEKCGEDRMRMRIMTRVKSKSVRNINKISIGFQRYLSFTTRNVCIETVP